MSRFVSIFAACGALALTSCATHLSAPDSAKLNAAAVKVQDDVTKARNLSRESRKHIADAQKQADTIVVASNDLQGKAALLLARVPEEYKPEVLALAKEITRQQEAEEELIKDLSAAQSKNDELEKHLAQTDADVADLQREKQSYFGNTQAVIDRANKDEQKLASYRRKWWGSWVVFGAGIIGCVVFAILKWGVKWGSKLAVAGAKVGI